MMNIRRRLANALYPDIRAEGFAAGQREMRDRVVAMLEGTEEVIQAKYEREDDRANPTVVLVCGLFAATRGTVARLNIYHHR